MSHLTWPNGSFKISDIIPAGPQFCRTPRCALPGVEQGDTALPLSTCCEEKHRKTVFGLLPCVGSVSLVLVFDLQMVQGEVMAPFYGSHMYRHMSVNTKVLK